MGIVNFHRGELQDDKNCANVKDLLRIKGRTGRKEWHIKAYVEMKAPVCCIEHLGLIRRYDDTAELFSDCS